MAGKIVKDDVTGLDKVQLSNGKGATAEVFIHGAHVTSWKSAEGDDLIFVSKKAIFKPPKAIRGGIPICFPQFGDFGPVEAQHGFARNKSWELDEAGSCDPSVVVLVLKPSPDDPSSWKSKLEARYGVTVEENGDLTTSLTVKNVGEETAQFTTALHTYFTIGDISQTKVENLQGVEYLDNLKKRERFKEEAPAVTFTGEVDRIYLDTLDKINIVDGGNGRTVVLYKANLPDAVVWNPWIEKSKGMADLGDEDFHHFVCVEAGAIGNPVPLEPGAEWTGYQTFSVIRP